MDMKEQDNRIATELLASASTLARLPDIRQKSEFAEKIIQTVLGLQDCVLCLKGYNSHSPAASACAKCKVKNKVDPFEPFECPLSRTKNHKVIQVGTDNFFLGHLIIPEISIEKSCLSDDLLLNFLTILSLSIENIIGYKEAKEELEFKNIILSTQQENSIDGILVVDDDGRIISFNKRFVDMWGIPPDVTESKSDTHALQSIMDKLENSEEFIQKVKHLYKARTETSRDEIALKDDRTFDRYSAPMIGADGKYYGRVWYFRDITGYKQVEEKLRENEERFRAVTQTANDAIITTDSKGDLIYWNQTAEEMFGYPSQQVIGQPITFLMPERFRVQHQEAMHQFAATAESKLGKKTVEVTGIRKDGSEFPIELSLARWNIKERIYFTSIIRDVSDRKRADQAIMKEKMVLRTLIDNLPSAVFVKDNEYRTVVANSLHKSSMAGHLSKIGLDPDVDIIGKTDFEITSNKLAEKYFIDDQKVIRDGQTILNKEEEGVGPDGRRIWLLISKIPLRDNEGTINGMLGITTNITERKNIEVALGKERCLFKMLMDNIPDHIYFKDAKSRFLKINKAQAEIFNLGDPEDAIGKTDFDFFTDEHARKAFEGEQKIIRTGQPIIDIEEKKTWSMQSATWVSTTKMPQKDEHGNIIGTFGISRDITRHKHEKAEILNQKMKLAELNKNLEFANVKLKELNSIKSDFLSTVSHEIRTPLAIVREAISLCLDGAGGKLLETHFKYLTSAMNNVDRLIRLVTDLLDISKIEQNKLKLRKTSMNLWGTTQKVYDEYKSQAESKNIRIELDKQSSDSNSMFYGDEDKIIQILNNLLSNAIHYTDSGKITIRLRDANDFFRFSVTDTGIGITKENASKLFKKFQQIGRTDGPGYKGTGLGLAISKGLVEKHGGKIWIESEPGQGSTFYFTLKKVLFPKILIVDDNQEMVKLIIQTLTETGYRFAEANDGSQAVRMAQNDPPNLIMLDIRLPTMSGYEVIGRLKQDNRTHDIPILIMSAFSIDMDNVDLISAEPAIPTIKKPFNIDELRNTVEKCLTF